MALFPSNRHNNSECLSRHMRIKRARKSESCRMQSSGCIVLYYARRSVVYAYFGQTSIARAVASFAPAPTD